MFLTVLLIAAGVFLLLLNRDLPRQVQVTTESEVPRISVSELQGQLQTSSPPLVWDIRPVEIFAGGHIAGSRPLNLSDVPDAAANLDKRQAIVTLCA
jgi:hypothetical protein